MYFKHEGNFQSRKKAIKVELCSKSHFFEIFFVMFRYLTNPVKRHKNKKIRLHEILSSTERIYEQIVLAEKQDFLHYLNWIEQIKAEVLNLMGMARNLIGDNYVDSSRILPKSVDQITENYYTRIDGFTYNNHNGQITVEARNLIGDNYVDSSRILPRCVDEQITENYDEHIYEKIDPWDPCGSFAADSKVKTLQKSTDIDSTVSSTDIGTKRQTESNISTNFSRIDNISRPITECQSGEILSETFSKLPSYSDVLRQDTDMDNVSPTSFTYQH